MLRMPSAFEKVRPPSSYATNFQEIQILRPQEIIQARTPPPPVPPVLMYVQILKPMPGACNPRDVHITRGMHGTVIISSEQVKLALAN